MAHKAPHLRQTLRPKGKPAAVENIGRAKRLLAGTLARAHKPKKLPHSMRAQILGLACHWFAMRLKRETVIYPGNKKMKAWGQCEERTAISNVSQMKAWGVLVATGHEKGGAGKATEFVFSVRALFDVLMTMDARPSTELWEALCECDNPHQNPAKFGSQIQPFQKFSSNGDEAENPATNETENPARKGATVAPRLSYDDRGSLSVAVAGASVEVCALSPSRPPGGAVEEDAGEKAAPALSLRSTSNVVRLLPSEKEKKRSSEAKAERASAPVACEAPDLSASVTGRPDAQTCAPDDALPPGLSDDAAVALAHLNAAGAATPGALGSDLGWGATRAWHADGALKAAGLITYNRTGQMVPVRTGPTPPPVRFGLPGAGAQRTTPRQ